ncbi:hypothetical protein A9Q89_11155 [Gammaproteobacteria bacterium 53_120_T64]|nr:hypothetical protein A9Q89_11155 [Gammaproteobacteria bacterium 53_120_T64]
MYSQFFGLQTSPFGITPDTSFFYSGGEREALISAIAYGISHGDGIIKVVGEVGSGKTMLSRMLASQLPDNINLVFLLNPSLRASDLIFAIGHDLGVQFTSQCSKNHALRLVQDKLLAMHISGQRVVVFIDEAQCMPLETLEELRLLSNLETETDKLLQLVLFGQPELDEHLGHSSVRQIRERIIHSFYLKPFTRGEVAEYLSFRLHKAGYNGAPIFSASALRLLTRCSSGLPRKLTILADKSLLAAFSGQSRRVTAAHVRLAAQDSGPSPGLVSSKGMVAMALAFALLLVVVVFYRPFSLAPSASGSQQQGAAVPLSAEQFSVSQPMVADVPRVKPQQALSQASPKAVLAQLDVTAVTLQALTLKTQRWLASSTDMLYTIQILSANVGDDQFLELFFTNIAEHIGLDELYVHPVSVDEKRLLAVTLGGFTSHTQAAAYLASLPDFIRRYQPYIKNIDSFKNHN